MSANPYYPYQHCASFPIEGGSWGQDAPATPEQKVLACVRAHEGPASLEQIEQSTFLEPDVAVKAVALLLQRNLLQVHKNYDERLLELLPA